MKEWRTPNINPTIKESIRNTFFNDSGINIDDYKTKLNLACGTDYLDGWINVDGSRTIKADMYFNLDAPDIKLPFQNDSIDFIYAAHILEHIVYLPQLQAELIRILKPEGSLMVIVPHYLSVDAWGDPTHCRAFSPASFYGLFWPGLYSKHYDEYGVSAEGAAQMNRKWIVCTLRKGEA